AGDGLLVTVMHLVFSRAPFFFSSRRRHTRLVSDWSSDVCSSDLRSPPSATRGGVRPAPLSRVDRRRRGALSKRPRTDPGSLRPRSEERRVGKECRSRWWPDG